MKAEINWQEMKSVEKLDPEWKKINQKAAKGESPWALGQWCCGF